MKEHAWSIPLPEEESFTKALVEMSNDAILVFDQEGRIEYVNKMAEIFTEKGEGELIGANVFPLLGEGAKEILKELRKPGDKTCQEMAVEIPRGKRKFAYCCFLFVNSSPSSSSFQASSFRG